MSKLTGAVAAVAALVAAAPAVAETAPRFQVKVGASGVLPDEGAKISAVGGTVKISDEIVPSLLLEYFFTRNVSAELLCCVARHEVAAVGTALGRVDLGKVTHFPPTVTVKYRLTDFGPVEPYVGAGANYTHFFDAKLSKTGAITAIDYGDSLGPALQAGADIRVNDSWFVNLDARKIWIDTKVKLSAGATRLDAKVKINPWVLSGSIGYRF